MQEPGLDYHIWSTRCGAVARGVREESPADAVVRDGPAARGDARRSAIRSRRERRDRASEFDDRARACEEQYEPATAIRAISREAVNGYTRGLRDARMPDELEARRPARPAPTRVHALRRASDALALGARPDERDGTPSARSTNST